MKLSVVIPAYNAAAFIEKSYQQLQAQELQEVEFLYVNNNSTDDTVAQIEKLQQTDTRVQFLQQPKQGAAAARNRGIQAAKSAYVNVVDVDDEIYPGALKEMMAVLDAHPGVEAVFGKMVKSYKGIAETKKPKAESGKVVVKEKPYWGLKWFSSLKDVVGPPAFLYRKKVFENIGYYNESIRNNEDTAFDIKLGMLCTVAFLDRYVYLYFKHASSTIQTSKRQMPRAFMVWPRLVKEHLPFYLSHEVPKRFETLLFSQLFQAMGRQLVYTRGYAKRRQLKKELLDELKAVKIPRVISRYLTILALCPWGGIHKVYRYVVVRYAVKHLPRQKPDS